MSEVSWTMAEVPWIGRRMSKLSPRKLRPFGRQGIDSPTSPRRGPESAWFAGQSTKPPTRGCARKGLNLLKSVPVASLRNLQNRRLPLLSV